MVCKASIPYSNWKKGKVLPVVALVCDYYNGNVKGELYFSKLAKRMREDAQFVIIGKGWKDVPGENVLHWCVSSYADVKRVFAYVDVVFIGSRYEAGPASFPDAVNGGKYVVSTKVGMVMDNFIEGCSGNYLSLNEKEDVVSIRMILEKVNNNISPLYRCSYLSWQEQIDCLLEFLSESCEQENT
ncbi:MAG: hypothetical protein COB51_00725 [Moraxellaceae bacterium]|nr:MAG: hypothetical protein COB51_00725 [Moraxellaceae bacterium]